LSAIDSEASARICVFCDGQISASDPPEHVFPKWLSKFRPKGAVFVHIPGPALRADGTMREFRSKNLELTADTICATCNHGWMSDLETNGAPILTPMVEGRTQGFDIERAVLVGTWVAKTALTFDQSMPSDRRMLPVEYCRSVYERRLPPPGSRVSLAHYEGDDDQFVRGVHHALYDDLPPDLIPTGPPQAHRTTIRIGQLVAEFTVTKDPEPVLSVRGGDLADMLINVWPSIEATSWPPRLRFNDASLASFTNPEMPST
jgi:hypothetical protein